MYLLDKNFHPSVETKPDPRSIEGLIAWLETMPADGTYSWCDSDRCVVAQYAHATFGTTNYHSALGAHKASFWSVKIGLGKGSDALTFGAALDRARAYQAKVRT